MDPIILRFFERLLVVLFGGMTIYLGFKLFHEMPREKDSTGRIILPWDISIIMTRVAPGVFFALFGAITVSLALMRPLEMSPPLENTADPADNVGVRYATRSSLDDPTARADARALLCNEMAVLNTLPSLLSENLAQHDKDEIERSIRDIKLALVKPVWGEPDEGFGDFSEFERWVKDDKLDPMPAEMKDAFALYSYGSKEKKQ